MDSALLNHLLQLAAKTGDRLIVVDPNSQQPFVLMGLPQYERLLGSRADARRLEPTVSVPPAMMPGLDPVAARANAELAAWRAQQPAVIVEQPATVEGFSPEPLQAVPPDEDRFYVEPLE